MSKHSGKQFIASWDEQYFVIAMVEEVAFDWFDETRGYSAKDIALVDSLTVGQSVELDKGHLVVRTL
jgi:hypothetical protein